MNNYKADGAQEVGDGLLWMMDGDAVLVIGPGYTDLASSDDYAFGDTLDEAITNYKVGQRDT